MHQRKHPRLTAIDLAAPGGLAALFAATRARFGDATMTAGGPGDPPPPPADPPQPTAPTLPFTPPASQEEYDRAVNARVARVREQYADYDQLKAAAEELATVKASQMSEQEKAVDAARTEGRSAAVREANEKAATAILRAGLSARGVSAEDQATLLEAVNVAAFIAGDDVDTDKVAAYATRVAGSPTGSGVDLGQGYRPNVAKGFGTAGRAEAQRRYPQTSTTT